MTALGTIVPTPSTRLGPTELYCGLLDYYDHWSEVDPRLAEHHEHLARAADVFGHDIVNMATYVHEILSWLPPERMLQRQSVVVVGGMTEAYLVSVRSACDAIADALAYVATEKSGQAPTNGLRGLVTWAKKNQARVRPVVMSVLSTDLDWFWNLRSLRDHIVHSGAPANIHCDSRQFNLWVHSPCIGWVTREPLLPLIASKLGKLLEFGDLAAKAINQVISLPTDRIHSRVVSGIFIPALHELPKIADEYARPSP